MTVLMPIPVNLDEGVLYTLTANVCGLKKETAAVVLNVYLERMGQGRKFWWLWSDNIQKELDERWQTR